MPKFVLNDASVIINSVDLSSDVRSVTLTYEAEAVETTAMGEQARTRLAGLKNWTAEIQFRQNFDAGKVDATLFPLVGAAPFSVAIKATSGAVSANNPEYSGNAILTSYQPITGTVGELAVAPVTLQGDGDLIRATS